MGKGVMFGVILLLGLFGVTIEYGKIWFRGIEMEPWFFFLILSGLVLLLGLLFFRFILFLLRRPVRIEK